MLPCLCLPAVGGEGVEYAKNCEHDPPIDMVQGSLDTQLGSAWQQSAASAVPGPDVGIWRGTPVNCLPCVDHLFIEQPAENHLSQSHTGHSSTLLTHLHPPRVAQSLHFLGRAVRLAVKNDARLCFAPLPLRSSVAAPRVVSYTVPLPYTTDRPTAPGPFGCRIRTRSRWPPMAPPTPSPQKPFWRP